MPGKPKSAVIQPPTLPSKSRDIEIVGARSNNLKNVSVSIPKNKLVVVTGLSGSGKSSLIMDTLYAEGQRRYVESLSSYARQFLNRMKKPDVDHIRGICPAIAIEQRVTGGNARSTVGSMTEIYDYLRLLFARIGQTISPISGQHVKKDSVTDVVNYIFQLPMGSRVLVVAPIQIRDEKRTIEKECQLLLQKGYNRIQWKGETMKIEDFLAAQKNLIKKKASDLEKGDISIVVDRFPVADDIELQKRVADSVQTAFYEAEGDCIVEVEEGKKVSFNNRFELDGMIFIEPEPKLFNYNNPVGACPRCEGFGRIIGIDEEKVIPDPSLSLYEGSVAPWTGEKSSLWQQEFMRKASKKGFPIHRPYADLSKAERKLLWDGEGEIYGIHAFFKDLEQASYKIQNRVMLARYRGRTTCTDCGGGRLRPEATYVKIGGQSLPELADMSVKELKLFFEKIKFTSTEQKTAARILLEIRNRLRTMSDVGLGYLNLERISSTLSGGETQRIHLTRNLGSNLTSSLYILDEPSIGLHPKDTGQLLKVLYALRDLGNTVVVVEHEEEIIRQADYIIDVGPEAGVHGGEIVYSGPYKEFIDGNWNGKASLTQQYLTRKKRVPTPKRRKTSSNKIILKGARMHNLHAVDVQIPLHCMTVVTGVSGSGKTTLIRHILEPALSNALGITSGSHLTYLKTLGGDYARIQGIEVIGQQALGRSSRSNPITYIKAYDAIRKLMTDQHLAKINGYKPKHFSFNVEGGRCETCKGDGEIVVEMQFLADVKLVCEECGGKRFQKPILEIKYQGKNIYDILEMSVDEAIVFFGDEREIVERLKPLQDVGLGYIKLGQASSTLSGGEAQRVKLASFLGRDRDDRNLLFIFDEPTTGLHFHDIHILLGAIGALVDKGHTVIIIEHNMEVIKTADWIIDMGPGGGDEGGSVVVQGTPEQVAATKESATGQYLKGKL
ncbi:MAG TPA: excinuclease ABC subunit UvrA [Saprospiraceae bacterium]|nr:excinuclease ABC subunit UvrA [Saprospiraceae bacterium]